MKSVDVEIPLCAASIVKSVSMGRLRKRREAKVDQVGIGGANIVHVTQTKFLPERSVLFPFASFLK